MPKYSCLIIFSILYAKIYALNSFAVITTINSPWEINSNIIRAVPENYEGKSFNIEINSSNCGRTVVGFGGAFNEKGWVALQTLSPDKRREALSALFDQKTGCRFNFCRVPIGSSDYALSRYTLDDVKDDYDMKSFSIDRDRGCLIPYIKAAMEFCPDLKLFASAWTPPVWMKTSGDYDGGQMKNDPMVYSAYALYLAKFAETYRAEGLNVTAVCVQNEPLIDRHYPSCLWTPQQFLTFIRDYAGPLFRKRNASFDLWLGTLQDGDYSKFSKTVLDDHEALKYVSAAGLQWDGIWQMPEIARNHPALTMIQTETECGNWYWRPGFNPDHPQNDWYYAVYTWKKVHDYMSAGASAYVLWNMVLDNEGKSIDSQKPWPQDSAVVIDTNSRSVTYTPMFYAFKHFSAEVDTGAKTLTTTGTFSDEIAFENPDGRIILEICNSGPKPIELKVRADGSCYSVAVPAESFVTAVL